MWGHRQRRCIPLRSDLDTTKGGDALNRHNARQHSAQYCEGQHNRGIAQSGSASGLGPEGREFESYCPDHSIFDRLV